MVLIKLTSHMDKAVHLSAYNVKINPSTVKYLSYCTDAERIYLKANLGLKMGVSILGVDLYWW